MGLYCFLFGHNTEGWEQEPGKFIREQYAPDPITKHKHQVVPAWYHFFGYGEHAWEWEHQECVCKRCKKVFWRADMKQGVVKTGDEPLEPPVNPGPRPFDLGPRGTCLFCEKRMCSCPQRQANGNWRPLRTFDESGFYEEDAESKFNKRVVAK